MSELKDVTVNVTMAEWEEMYNAKQQLEKYKKAFDEDREHNIQLNNTANKLVEQKTELIEENIELKNKLEEIKFLLEQIKNLI